MTKCPHCHVKLGDFLYADSCPHCHQELTHNTRPLTAAKTKDPNRKRSWLARCFFSVVRFVEG